MQENLERNNHECPLLNVVLFQPEIPQNTGNIGRLCAYVGIRLHLIHPLGFSLSEKNIRRSGMDYWKVLDKVEHVDWQAFSDYKGSEGQIWLMTTQAKQTHWDAEFQVGDYLLFGNEGHGCSAMIHESVPDRNKLKIPQLAQGQRSLNLATSAGIVVYEALKRIKENVKFAVY